MFHGFGNLILVDGTSSAGKTSICKKLVQYLHSPYVYVAIDDFITDVFEQQKKSPSPRQEFVIKCNKQVELMYKYIVQLVQQGKNVLCDTTLVCLEDATSVGKWFDILAPVNLFLVLAYCPLHVLAQRITERNQRALACNQPDQTRLVPIVLDQFIFMFKPCVPNDMSAIDKLMPAHVDHALELARNGFGCGAYDLSECKNKILLHLNVRKNGATSIAPRLSYDCIVNTEKNTTAQSSKYIAQRFFMQNRIGRSG